MQRSSGFVSFEAVLLLRPGWPGRDGGWLFDRTSLWRPMAIRVVRRSLSSRLLLRRSLCSTSSPPPPLQGIRVVDAGNFLAGPVVSLHLAALGAEVIKVEKIKGDDARTVGPFAGGESSYYLSLNRGKRSIAVDLRRPAQRQGKGRVDRTE